MDGISPFPGERKQLLCSKTCVFVVEIRKRFRFRLLSLKQSILHTECIGRRPKEFRFVQLRQRTHLHTYVDANGSIPLMLRLRGSTFLLPH